MDQCVARIPEGVTVRHGDELIAIAADRACDLSAEAVAARLDTIPYELLAGISARTPRVYIQGERVIGVEEFGEYRDL